AEAADAVRKDGLRLVAVELTADAVPLHEAPLDGDVCLAVGGEDHGCSPALLAAADAVAYIPQIGRVGSLNVAVAAAIALAEARRREWSAWPAPPGRRSGRPLAEPLVRAWSGRSPTPTDPRQMGTATHGRLHTARPWWRFADPYPQGE